MTINDSEKDTFYRNIFKNTQVGSIIKVIRPVSSESSISEITHLFNDNPDIDSMPVADTNGDIMGLIYKDKIDNLQSQSSSFWGAIFPEGKTIKNYIDLNCSSIDARKYIESALDQLISAGKENMFRDFIITNYNEYIGIGKVADLIVQINKVRNLSLAVSKKVQSFFINKNNEVKLPFDIYSYSSYSADLGGDFYKYMQIDEDTYMIGIFDVSGKDISASLFTASLSAFFSTVKFVFSGNLKEETIVENLNSMCYDQTSAWMFITGILVFINSKTRMLKYYNYGHPPGIFLTSYSVKSLKFSKIALPPLGAIKKQKSKENVKQVKLGACDRLFLYTDGLSEAQNIEGDLFGVKRIEKILSQNSNEPSEILFDKIKENLESFVKEKVFSDDVTLLLLDFDRMVNFD